MEKIEQLKEIITSYWHIGPDSVDWDTSFNSQQLKTFSSLRMLRFLASIEERLQVNIEDPDAIRTFKDLKEAIQV